MSVVAGRLVLKQFKRTFVETSVWEFMNSNYSHIGSDLACLISVIWVE